MGIRWLFGECLRKKKVNEENGKKKVRLRSNWMRKMEIKTVKRYLALQIWPLNNIRPFQLVFRIYLSPCGF